jgi:hypothetical protein
MNFFTHKFRLKPLRLVLRHSKTLPNKHVNIKHVHFYFIKINKILNISRCEESVCWTQQRSCTKQHTMVPSQIWPSSRQAKSTNGIWETVQRCVQPQADLGSATNPSKLWAPKSSTRSRLQSKTWGHLAHSAGHCTSIWDSFLNSNQTTLPVTCPAVQDSLWFHYSESFHLLWFCLN